MRRLFYLLTIAMLFVACAAPKTITVTEYRETIRADTVERLKVDSVYVSHYIMAKGDTVHMRDTIFKYKILHQTETQTEYVRDSIPYPVEVVREVRKRDAYDRFTSGAFWIMIVLLLLRVAWWVVKKYYRIS